MFGYKTLKNPLHSTISFKKKYISENQVVNNHFGGSLNLTSHQSDLAWVEFHLAYTKFNKNIPKLAKVIKLINSSALSFLIYSLISRGFNLTSCKKYLFESRMEKNSKI